MSVNKFLTDQVDKKEVSDDLKKFRKPIKYVTNNKKECSSCGKNRFIVVYKMKSDKILAYKCDYCGDVIFKKEKKSKKIIKKEENGEFKCLLGDVKFCIDLCIIYKTCCLRTKN